MSNIIDELGKLFKPKKPDVQPQPLPVPNFVDKVPYLRVLALLRDVNLKKLWPVFVSVPAIVFFAISGLLAWCVLVVKFVTGIFRLW